LRRSRANLVEGVLAHILHNKTEEACCRTDQRRFMMTWGQRCSKAPAERNVIDHPTA
jgi:hypothetical protein